MKYIFLHHTAIKGVKPQFGQVNEVHKKKKFKKSSLGYFVGYNFLIESDGTLEQARTETEEGCHTTTKKILHANKKGIGICLAGDFTKQKPSSAQICTLAELIVYLQLRHDISEDHVYLHRELKATACPGTDLRELTVPLRQKLLSIAIGVLTVLALTASGPLAFMAENKRRNAITLREGVVSKKQRKSI